MGSSPLTRVASEPKFLKPSKLADSIDREISKYKKKSFAETDVANKNSENAGRTEKLLKPAVKRTSSENVDQTPVKRFDSDQQKLVPTENDESAPPSPPESVTSIASSTA